MKEKHFINRAVKFFFTHFLKLFVRSLGAKECLLRKCLPVDEEVFLCSSIHPDGDRGVLTQLSLHRTCHI